MWFSFEGVTLNDNVVSELSPVIVSTTGLLPCEVFTQAEPLYLKYSFDANELNVTSVKFDTAEAPAPHDKLPEPSVFYV